MAVCAGLAACAHTGTDQMPETAMTVPLSQAMVFPPPGGPALVSVVETRYANATRQRINLATNARTPGESAIMVTRFHEAAGDGNFGELQDPSLLEADLASEAQAAWPEANMEVSPYYVQNEYGPFGYAVGQAPSGDTCLYGWQRIEPRLRPSGAIERGTVSLRVQVCDRAASERELVGLMYLLRLRDPVNEPRRASPAIGQPNAPIVPKGEGGFAAVLTEPLTRPEPEPQVTVVRAQADPTPAAQPDPVAEVPTGPIVPLPTRAGRADTADGDVTVPLPPSDGE